MCILLAMLLWMAHGGDNETVSGRTRAPSALTLPPIAGAVAVEGGPAGEGARADVRLAARSLRADAVARRTADGARITGAASGSLGGWRWVAGGYRLKTLAGSSSGTSSRFSESLWRRGPSLLASRSATASSGIALARLSGGMRFAAATDGGDATVEGRPPGWIALAGGKRSGCDWELVCSSAGRSNPIRLDGALGRVGARDGLVVGVALWDRYRALRFGFRRTIGDHRASIVWSSRGSSAAWRTALGTPRSGWVFRYRVGGFAAFHRHRIGTREVSVSDGIEFVGRSTELTWRARVGWRTRSGRPRGVLTARLAGLSAGTWNCRIDLKLEATGDSLLSSLVAFRARRPLGSSGTVELRTAFAGRGAFWVGRPRALSGIRPVWLEAGQRIVTLRYARGRVTGFVSERGSGREHRIECGIACRWQVVSEDGS